MKSWRTSPAFFAWKRLQWERQGHKCFYCDCPLSLRSVGNAKDIAETERLLSVRAATADHLIPRALGGRDEAENCLLACAPCNVKKGHRLPTLAEVVLFIDLKCLEPSVRAGSGPIAQRLLALARTADRKFGLERS